MILKQKTGKKPVFCFGDPNGIRTHDTTVKGWCLNRLTMGPRRRSSSLPKTIWRLFLGLADDSSSTIKILLRNLFIVSLCFYAPPLCPQKFD